jgi:hypothetical protein
MKNTITLTFRDQLRESSELSGGLLYDDLKEIQKYFKTLGAKSELVRLNTSLSREENINTTNAYILIVKNGVKYLEINPEELLEEQKHLDTDKHTFMYGRVVDKTARHTLCFDDFDQEPDYENKKERVYNFSQLPLLNKLRDKISCISGTKNLVCNGNYYYDVKKTYIGFHGDDERKTAIGVRLGEKFNLYFQWFFQGTPRGELWKFELKHGDMYFMCEKSIGSDWKKRDIYTLRHAASKYPKLVGIVEN